MRLSLKKGRLNEGMLEMINSKGLESTDDLDDDDRWIQDSVCVNSASCSAQRGLSNITFKSSFGNLESIPLTPPHPIPSAVSVFPSLSPSSLSSLFNASHCWCNKGVLLTPRFPFQVSEQILIPKMYLSRSTSRFKQVVKRWDTTGWRVAFYFQITHFFNFK